MLNDHEKRIKELEKALKAPREELPTKQVIKPKEINKTTSAKSIEKKNPIEVLDQATEEIAKGIKAKEREEDKKLIEFMKNQEESKERSYTKEDSPQEINKDIINVTPKQDKSLGIQKPVPKDNIKKKEGGN